MWTTDEYLNAGHASPQLASDPSLYPVDAFPRSSPKEDRRRKHHSLQTINHNVGSHFLFGFPPRLGLRFSHTVGASPACHPREERCCSAGLDGQHQAERRHQDPSAYRAQAAQLGAGRNVPRRGLQPAQRQVCPALDCKAGHGNLLPKVSTHTFPYQRQGFLCVWTVWELTSGK